MTHEEAGSKRDPEQSRRSAKGARYFRLGEQLSPVARSDRGVAYLQLLLIVLALLLVGGAAFLVGRRLASKEVSGEVQPPRTRSDALGVLSSLDTSDDRVDQLIASMNASYSGAELSSPLNTRGLSIYNAEKTRATARKNTYSREEIERALRWFERARQLDALAIWPHWNAACMLGLLGRVAEAIQSLDNLKRVLPPSRKAEFDQKVASDPDFCPIETDPVFGDYLGRIWKQRQAKCPEPAIQTR
ncbi:MAG: hypothetical protein WAV20_08975 [Blastocatellia bacterium]